MWVSLLLRATVSACLVPISSVLLIFHMSVIVILWTDKMEMEMLLISSQLPVLCLCQRSGQSQYVFWLFVSLCVCLPVCLSASSLHASWTLLTQTISWKVLDVFSPNFQHWCILGQGWTPHVLWSEGQSSRSWWIQHHRKCIFGPCWYNILKIPGLNFTKLSMLMHHVSRTNASNFGIKRSKVKTKGLAGGGIQSSTQRRVLISSLASNCLRFTRWNVKPLWESKVVSKVVLHLGVQSGFTFCLVDIKATAA